MSDLPTPTVPTEAARIPTAIPLREADGGVRLDRFLASRLGLSRADARRLLAEGHVMLDGRVRGYQDKGLMLPSEGVIEVADPRSRRELQVLDPASGSAHGDPAANPQLPTLAAGPGWLVVDKPAGWPVHPLREDEDGTVLNAVAATHPEIRGVGDEGGLRSGVVHRLDVGTSGALVLATSEAQWARLRSAFQDHHVEKVYRALVAGNPGEDLAPADGAWGKETQLELAVARHRPALVRVVDERWDRGKRSYPARQSVRIVERFEGAALVEVRIVTGFLHQVRVTLAHHGHPILGDALYGREGALAHGAERQMLHAARLRFEEIAAESPDPPDLRALLAQLRGA